MIQSKCGSDLLRESIMHRAVQDYRHDDICSQEQKSVLPYDTVAVRLRRRERC